MKNVLFLALTLMTFSVHAQVRYRTAMPRNAVLVPSVAQTTDYTCGPTTILSILRYFQLASADTEFSLAAEMRTTYEWGTHYRELAALLQRRGLDAVLETNAKLSELEAELALGYPVIVNFKSFGVGHYAVAVAMDKRYVYLMDPWMAPDRVRMRRADFQRKWFDEHQGVRLEGLMIAVRNTAPLAR